MRDLTIWGMGEGTSAPTQLQTRPAAPAKFVICNQTIEHTFPFFKQVLGWTTPRVRHPEQADRWTWLLLIAFIQLRLARSLVADGRLPWEKPLAPVQLAPGRVRRAFSQLLPALGSPVNLPKLCGRSPGRPKGRRSKPAQRFPAVKKAG